MRPALDAAAGTPSGLATFFLAWRRVPWNDRRWSKAEPLHDPEDRPNGNPLSLRRARPRSRGSRSSVERPGPQAIDEDVDRTDGRQYVADRRAQGRRAQHHAIR